MILHPYPHLVHTEPTLSGVAYDDVHFQPWTEVLQGRFGARMAHEALRPRTDKERTPTIKPR